MGDRGTYGAGPGRTRRQQRLGPCGQSCWRRDIPPVHPSVAGAVGQDQGRPRPGPRHFSLIGARSPIDILHLMVGRVRSFPYFERCSSVATRGWVSSDPCIPRTAESSILCIKLHIITRFLPRSEVLILNSPCAYRPPVASAPWKKRSGETTPPIQMAAMVLLRAETAPAVA
jgi:hypothetical protein